MELRGVNVAHSDKCFIDKYRGERVEFGRDVNNKFTDNNKPADVNNVVQCFLLSVVVQHFQFDIDLKFFLVILSRFFFFLFLVHFGIILIIDNNIDLILLFFHVNIFILILFHVRFLTHNTFAFLLKLSAFINTNIYDFFRFTIFDTTHDICDDFSIIISIRHLVFIFFRGLSGFATRP